MHQYFNNVEISADVMFLNGYPFLASISEHIHYGTEITVDNLKCSSIESQVKSVIRYYDIRGFSAVLIGVDIQFKALKDRN